MPTPAVLSDMAVFVAVVRRGSFSAAADQLDVSKSQVSKCVSRLEQALGARLLQRTTRRQRLTEAGSTLYEASVGALDAIDVAQVAVSRLQGAPRGTLKVSASIAFGSTHLPGIVSALLQRNPELSVELLLEDRHVDLVREGIDVAVRITVDAPDSGLVFRRLAPNRQVVCAAPSYIQRRGLPRTLQDLAAHDCIAHTQRGTPRTWHLTAADGSQAAVQINGRLAISNALAVRQAALEGLGIVEINSYLVGADIEAGRLVRLLPQYRPKELSFYAVYPARPHLAPKVRVFVEAMLERMAPEPGWDAFLRRRGPPGLARAKSAPGRELRRRGGGRHP
jgi:DNA-binding transcriptional LysR family regulator